MKKIGILQSNYIPWKGYFDLINRVDEFVIYDDVQYTTGDWRNRNKIKTPQGIQWLTIPVLKKGKFLQPIKDTKVKDHRWCVKHWRTLKNNYSKAPYFKEYESFFEDLYLTREEEYLSEINYIFIKAIMKRLGVSTKLSWSSDFNYEKEKNKALISICHQTNATHYLSGPAAKSYIDIDKFNQNSIEVAWMDYAGYPEYDQIHPPFEHGVTILDLLFHTGPNAMAYLKKSDI